MNLPTVVTSVSASGPERVESTLAALRSLGPCLLVGPRRSTADELAFRLAEEGTPTAGVHRSTMHLLAAEFATPALAREGRVLVGSVGVRSILARVVDQARDEGQLEWFAEVAGLPGFLPSLQRTLDELRRAGVTAELLAGFSSEGDAARSSVPLERAHLRLLQGSGSKRAGPGTSSSRSLGELALLMEGAELEFARWGLADSSWLLARSIELIHGASDSGDADAREVAQRLLAPWSGLPQVWLDVPLHSMLEREFFAATSALAHSVQFIAPARDRQTLDAVAAVAAAAVTSRCEPSVALNSQLRATQERIFAVELDVETVEAEDSSFEFFSAAGEGQECVEIARRIGELGARGVRFDEVAVLVRQPATYLPLLEDAMHRAGIPVYCARGSSRPDPSGRAFLALLACAEEGLSATRFAEYLSFDQVPVEPGAGNKRGSTETSDSNSAVHSATLEVPWVPPADNQLVLKSLFAAGESDRQANELAGAFVPADREREQSEHPLSSEDPAKPRYPTPAAWERLIVDAAVVGGADRWRRRIKGLQNEIRKRLADAAGEDGPLADGLALQVARLETLQEVALPIIDQLEALPTGQSWADWIEALERLAVASLRFPASVLSLLADLRPMAAVEDVDLSQVQKVLEGPLRTIEAEPPKRRAGAVFVGAIEQARGRSFRAVFVPGLAEGVFPARAVEDPLLLDAVRERIADALGAESALETQPTRFHRERLLLRLALGAASETLVVSYPRIDAMLGRARVPSFYALDILRAAEGRIPTIRELEERAAESGAAGASWPAPQKPEHAIDDAEFDLSLLHPEQQEPGAARFLLSANPHLCRSLNARARRWRRPFTWADGLLADQAEPDDRATVARILGSQRPSERSYSPTALQHYAQCPYRFLLQAIHRLRPSEDRTGFEQLDPLTRGSLFHDVQFELFGELREQQLLPVTGSNLGRVLGLADGVLDRVAERTYEDTAPAIDRIWNAEIDSLRNDLRGWLRLVSEQSQWRPVMAEMGFGLKRSADRDPASVEEPVNVAGYLLRGSIDLVEVSERRRALRVTDHKTGRRPRDLSLTVDGGKVLQPTLYALVAERLLESLPPESFGLCKLDPDEQAETSRMPDAFRESSGLPPQGADGAPRVEAGRLFFCTTKGGFNEVEVPLTPGARKSALTVLETVDQSVRDGFLPAAPAEGACRFCDYRIVCGPYEERRIQRKEREPLLDLQALRRLR